MDKKNVIIALLALALIIAVTYIYYEIFFTEIMNSCRQEGINSTLQGLVDQIKLRGSAIQIKVEQEQLICSIGSLINGTH